MGFDLVRQRIVDAHSQKCSTIQSVVEVVPKPWPTAPTYFKTNKFSYSFQEFVNTYGIPRYQEANPALFTAAAFPFLFGVMYGDIGHGLFLMSAGLYLILNEKKMANERLGEMLDGLFGGRYMIFMMGCFA